ncbi:MAG: O-antigen ligase domain-containing protein [Tannerella sp.]|nr:O-antigen ligase domain-containing protein [Tannerella sp.]
MMMMMEGNGQMLTETENAEQLRVNKYFFALFVFTLIFVVVLYKMIGFAYTDELCSLFLFFLFFLAMTKIHRWHFNKAFLVTLFVFFFYTCYSLWIGSNTPRGIANDAIIQIKPYLGFFCVYQLKPVFNESRKRILGDVCLLFWFIFLLPVGLVSLVNEKIFTVLLEHPAYYGIAVTIVSLCYLYCSRFTRRDKVVFLLMLSIGLLCGRSKFYGFFALSVFMMFFFSNIAHLKLNFRNVVILLCMFAAVIYVAWGKISLYFYQVLSDEMDKDLVARFVLYRTMPEVLHDYFPFGSGFASFGTYSSGQYYSDLYAQYGIEYIYGLSKAYHDFISDTFYPSLAQFGAAGIVLFVLFWIYILKRAFMNYRKSPDIKLLQIAILIVCFLGIENTTGSTFTAQGGFFVMMLMGVVLSERRRDAGQTVISEHGG